MINDVGHMAKKATKPINGKNTLKLTGADGAGVKVSDFGPRGPWFEPRPVHSLL